MVLAWCNSICWSSASCNGMLLLLVHGATACLHGANSSCIVQHHLLELSIMQWLAFVASAWCKSMFSWCSTVLEWHNSFCWSLASWNGLILLLVYGATACLNGAKWFLHGSTAFAVSQHHKWLAFVACPWCKSMFASCKWFMHGATAFAGSQHHAMACFCCCCSMQQQQAKAFTWCCCSMQEQQTKSNAWCCAPAKAVEPCIHAVAPYTINKQKPLHYAGIQQKMLHHAGTMLLHSALAKKGSHCKMQSSSNSSCTM